MKVSSLTLNDVCEAIIDCEHKTAPTQPTGHPSIRTPNIGRGRLILDGVNRVSEETYKLWTQRMEPQPGDLILAREAPVGNVAIIPRGLRVCLGQRTVLIRADRRKVLPEYLVYLMLGDEIQGRVKSLSNGATVHHLNMKDIRGLMLPPLPEMDEQCRIASILSAYDDLIENNTRRIAILEEMARRVYEERFVHFRFRGHENVRITQSELGSVPEGWSSQHFAALLESWKGGDWGSDEPSGSDTEPVFVIRGTDFDDLRQGTGNRVPRRFIEKKSLERRKLKPFDLVVENSINAKSRSVGSTLLITPGVLRTFRGDAIAASFCKVFRFHTPQLAALAHMEMRHLFETGKMAFYQNVAANGIANFQARRLVSEAGLTMPTDPLLRDRLVDTFISFTSSILADAISNLRATRDLLLPKLISGELEVPPLPEPEDAVA